MRSPTLLALLAPVLTVALVGPAGPAAAADPAAVDTATGGVVADTTLTAQMTRATAELTEGTRALEQGQAHLAEVRRQGTDARARAQRAAAEAEVTRQRLGALVGVAYRSPGPAGLTLVLSGPNGLAEALSASASLAHVQGRQEEVAAEATAERTRAVALAREAQRLEAAATDEEQVLRDQVASLQDQAEQARVRLEAAAQADRAAAGDRASRDRGAAPAFVGTPAAGCGGGTLTGYANGMLPASALCPLDGTAGLLLRADAAAAFNRMAAVGGMPCAGNSYRSYAEQVALYRQKPSLAAVPGTSNHGWGVAVDFACGADRFGSAAYVWLQTNGPTYGWTHPSWADAGGSRPEPWHWEYTG